MGVHGLWRLIEPSGKPVPFETLENKVLAVDISLWLHQAVKGFQDSKGAPLPNAHLLGIYHRLCKLLYFRIKPVFVFDGGVPELKRQTIAKRKQSKAINASKADEIQRELLQKLLKHTAISKVLEDKLQLPEISETYKKKDVKKDMYALDNLESSLDPDSTLSSSDDESSNTEGDSSSPSKYVDLHSVDLESAKFKSLPVDVRHDILTDLKETRKQSSWGKIHQIPKIIHEFSSYQMKRLLKRQAVQSALEEAEKEMGGKTLSLAELESMLKDQGIITDDSLGKKIASDEHAKYLLVKANQKEAEQKKLKPIAEEETEDDESSLGSKQTTTSNENLRINLTNDSPNFTENKPKLKADQEFDEDLQKAIVLSLMEEPSTSKGQQEPSFLEKFNDADFMSSSSSDDNYEETSKQNIKRKTIASAEHYMMEYSGLTPSEIAKIIESKTPKPKTSFKKQKSIEVFEKIDNSQNIKLMQESSSKPTEIKNFKKSLTEKKVEETAENMPSADEATVMSSSSEDSDDLVEVESNGVDGIESFNKEINLAINDFKDKVEKEDTKIEVIVNPSGEFDQKDDLFGDIFESSIEFTENISNAKNNKEDIGITTNTNKKMESNNLFDDTISLKDFVPEENTSDDLNLDKIVKDISEQKSNEIKHVESNIHELSSTSIVQEDQYKQSKNEKKSNVVLEKPLESAEGLNTPQPSKVMLPDDSIEIINNLQKANRTGSLNKQLTELKNKLQQETNDLLVERGAKQRMAENITDQMYQEAQDLLELFGVPYIIAPMEAEAQCAFLDEIELTNGTITDDSDIWLFGGRTVYKNFFNQNKYVMEFKAENIEHHFKLSREQMILLALLVGSDYTNGLQGVGPVTALEILAAFPPSRIKESDWRQLVSGLKEFRSWFTKDKSPGIGRTALKKKLKNLTFTDTFPSIQVVQAYLEPKVETSDDLFSWGKPNFDALIEFAKDKFGWTKLKAEQIINPVLQKMHESRMQRSIKDYFTTRFKMTDSGKVQDQMSKRVKSAVTNMGKDADQILADEFAEEIAKELKRKNVKRKAEKKDENTQVKPKKSKKRKDVDKTDIDENAENQETTKKKTIKKIQVVETKAVVSESQRADNLSETDEENSKEGNKNDNQNLGKSKGKRKLKNKVNLQTQTKLNESGDNESVKEILNTDDEIVNKIALIRQRRETKRLKALLEAQTAIKLDKFKPKEKKKEVVEVPEALRGDEDVDVLVQAALISESKVEEIYKKTQEEVDNLNQPSTSKSSSGPKLGRPNTTKLVNTLKPSVSKGIPRIPQKDVIPQKKQDQAMILRNKMKAIEVFRKSKKGPGYVTKNQRKKRLSKADADLSESSD